MRENFWRLQSRVHGKVAQAVKTGKLIKPSQCSRCLEIKPLEAHHDDYANVLNVIWLCLKCHRARHRELGTSWASDMQAYADDLYSVRSVGHVSQ